MTNRERVVRAINFENPDKVPLWLLNKNQEDGDILWYDIRIQKGEHSASYHGGDKSEWGFTWKRLDDGTMGMPDEPVIKTWDDLEKYKMPELDPDRRLKDLPDFLKRFEGYFRLAVPIITGFETYRALWGFENTMIDFAEEREEALVLLDKIMEFEKELMTLSAEHGFDGFYFGDDWGGQRGVLMGAEMWREFIKPRIRQMYDLVKSKGKFVLIHTCGKVQEIIPDFIEVGVEIFNPFQPEVMDVYEVKKKYGRDLSFYGGISIQQTLPYGSVQDVKDEGRRLYCFAIP